jgi:hypothetical protein
LVIIALRKFADTLFIPSGGVRLFSLLRHCRFLRWRLRNACFALRVRSKAVTTNTPSPTESGTLTTCKYRPAAV